MKRIAVLDATARGVVCGRHSIWAPGLGVKLPFSWGGQLTKYGKSEPGYHPEDTLPHELSILRALAEEGMAPPVGSLVYVETLISEHRGAWHADPTGCWGYEMWDANSLPPGRFSIDRMRALPISGSEGAWGDVVKPGNVVNGYLVDVRRSAWDMLRWTGGYVPSLPWPLSDLEALRERVHRECQFPPGERAEAYQDFWIGSEIERGQRRVVERAEAMGFRPKAGESVLDIGTQSGGFLQLAARAGATHLAGVDVEPSYIECARALARSNGQNICFRLMDVVREREAFLAWIRGYFPRGVDHLLCCALEKHVGEGFLMSLIDSIGARHTYVETNGIKSKSDLKMWPDLQSRGAAHVGFTDDRSLRALYRLDRFAQAGGA